ncbi:hypothetical protein LOAG_04637 [Loa loa]|uniref:Uncharacterized protein n=1 Tax=Loa loa TaxID=7209 RepID=A0A1S0U3E0_LOALO|nr:hypothetical protein LOAG_04637 [Loa loa]EFO23850.2 hypothetical protein LOAG_04637 [Loa loa]
MVAKRMHSKLSIIKSLSEDPLMSTSVTSIVDGMIVTTKDADIDDLQGFPSSVIVEGHSEVTLKNHQHIAGTSTILHCPVSELISKIVSFMG